MRYIYGFLFSFVFNLTTSGQAVTTFSGTAGLSGLINSSGSASRFNEPYGITADKNGNLFVADRLNNVIRKINPSGVTTTFAGSGLAGSSDGTANTASFNEPWAIANDTLGNLYVADTKSYKIRKIDVNGNVTTVAGTGVFGTTNGPVNVSRFGFSSGIAVTKDGNTIYVADYNTHVIRKIENGIVSNLAGIVFIVGSNDGAGATATFNHPHSLEIDNTGNLLVSDSWNNTLRKITPLGNVSTFAGNGLVGGIDGPTTTCSFNYPWDITIDTLGNIFVLDGYNFTVRKISPSNIVTTYVGTALALGSTDGIGAAARFNNPAGMVYNRADKALYIADTKNHTIRKVANTSSIAITLSITGTSTVCYGATIQLTAIPSSLTNYVILENGSQVGSSSTSSISITGLSAGTHTLICNALDVNGAVASSNTITVTVAAPYTPTITSSNGTTICGGDSVRLTAPTGTSYNWSNGATSSSIYASTAGNYSCTITNSAGCTGQSNSISLTVQPTPIATIASNATSVCPGDSVLLTASSGTSWLWSNGIISQTIYAIAGSYTVTVSNNGCSSISSPLTITNFAVTTPIINPSSPISIVQGDSIQLTASGSGSFLWSNGLTGSSIYASAAGSLSVTLTNTNGCDVTSIPVIINIISGNTIISANGVTTFCYGNSVDLTSIFPTSNQWYYNGQALPGETNQTLTAIDSGYYLVANWQGGNWIYSDSILISVLPTPQYPQVNDTAVCKESPVTLQAKGNDFYQWFADETGTAPISANATLNIPSINSPTTYYVQATNSYGCTTIDRLNVNVSLLPSPQISITPSTQVSGGFYTTTFVNSTTNADTYFWTFGDTSQTANSSTEVSPIHTYPTSGQYNISLIAINSTNGCVDTLLKTVNIVGNNSMYVPTTFTPNGDGINDVFRVRGDNFTVQEMLIFDQWGTLIYSSNSSRPTWDGTVNGTTTQNGTYVYKIVLLNDEQTTRTLTGSISVIK
jgi:gliding motility-associated-like protein